MDRTDGDVTFEDAHTVDVGVLDAFYTEILDAGNETYALIRGASQFALTDDLILCRLRLGSLVGIALGASGLVGRLPLCSPLVGLLALTRFWSFGRFF